MTNPTAGHGDATIDHQLPGFTGPLHWKNPPRAADRSGPAELTIEAGARTDLFTDPASGEVTANAAMLLGPPPDHDFSLSAIVSADLASTYDAGALVAYATEDQWAKFALERSPRGRPTIVSVVTNSWSDDANAIEIDARSARLRLSRVGAAMACHVLVDDDYWYLVRYFRAPGPPSLVGFLAQSPTGTSLRASFAEIELVERTVTDVRDGS